MKLYYFMTKITQNSKIDQLFPYLLKIFYFKIMLTCEILTTIPKKLMFENWEERDGNTVH